MNNTLNLVNNEENTILQQKNYPSAISESEKMCSSDGYKTLWKYRGFEEGKLAYKKVKQIFIKFCVTFSYIVC